MINYIRNYFRMKRDEIRVKTLFYGILAGAADSRRDIWDLIQKLYLALKDVPAEDLQKELVSALAEIIHSENKKD